MGSVVNGLFVGIGRWGDSSWDHRTNRFSLDLVHSQMFASCGFDKIRQVSTYATRMGSGNFNLWMLDSGA